MPAAFVCASVCNNMHCCACQFEVVKATEFNELECNVISCPAMLALTANRDEKQAFTGVRAVCVVIKEW